MLGQDQIDPTIIDNLAKESGTDFSDVWEAGIGRVQQNIDKQLRDQNIQQVLKDSIFNTDPKFNPLREKYGYEIDFYGNVRKKKALGGLIKKYEHGGSVQGENITPTITDYFSEQGKTLGGSDRESLAEKLGRK